MTAPDRGPIETPRPWVRRLALLGLALFVLASAGTIQLSAEIARIAAALPPAPDLQQLVVSPEVTDRDGLLLRPFTTPDGRWRLPVSRRSR